VFKKSIALAVPALAATALVATSLSGGAVQAKPDTHVKPAFAKGAKAKAVTVTACNGTKQKRSRDRGIAGYIYTYDSGSATTLPGSTIHIPGPAKGFDWVSVNLSAGTYLDSGAYGQVHVTKNGVPMRPSDNVDGSWHYQTGYGSFSRNYCAKVGKAGADLRVVIDAYDSDGTANDYFYLYDPMLHVEQSE
jgi:hypothetical protein